MRMACLFVVGCAIGTATVHAAPTAAQRKELVAIRREVIAVSQLIRRRKYDQARKQLKEAEERFNKLLKAAKFNPRDRSVLTVKRWFRLLKGRLLRLPKSKTVPRVQKPKPKTKSGRTIGIPRKSPSVRKLQAARKAARQRHQRDLAYWKAELEQRAKPQAVDRARYHIGLLETKLKQWKPAAETFETLVKQSPKDAWATAAKCRLVELKLEHFRDHQAADELIKPLLEWAWEKDKEYTIAARKAAEAAKQAKEKAKSNDVRAKPQAAKAKPKKKARKKPQVDDERKTPSFALKPLTEKQNAAEIYRTAAILAVTKGRLGSTKRYLLKARMWTGRPKGPSTPDEIARQRTLAMVMSRRGLTSLTVWKSKKDVYPYIVFADYLLLTGDYDRPLKYITALLKDDSLKFSDYQTSYLHYLRGRSCNGLRDRKRRAKAADDFLAAHKRDPQAPWADDCLFLAANARWNHEHADKKAIALWKQLRREFPNSRHADRSAYYIGVLHQQARRYADAKAAFALLLKEKPQSAYAKLTAEKLKTVERELARSER